MVVKAVVSLTYLQEEIWIEWTGLGEELIIMSNLLGIGSSIREG